MHKAVGVLSFLLLSAAPAAAQETFYPPDHAELKLGLLAHDAPLFAHPKEGGFDVNAELLLPSPVTSDMLQGIGQRWHWLLQPRPHIGGAWNDQGGTSEVYVGFTDTAILGRDVLVDGDALFFSAGFGPSINNGHTSTILRTHKSLGANVLFHPLVEFGWQVTPRVDVAIYAEHVSNAGLARYNESLNDAGLRVGFSF